MEGARMSATTTAVVMPAEKAAQIDNIFDGLVAIGCQLAWAADGVRDGIVLHCVSKKDSMSAQEYCLAAGILVAGGWLSMVVVQGRLKGFIRAYPKAEAAPAAKGKVLQFPRRKCEKVCASDAGNGRNHHETLGS